MKHGFYPDVKQIKVLFNSFLSVPPDLFENEIKAEKLQQFFTPTKKDNIEETPRFMLRGK